MKIRVLEPDLPLPRYMHKNDAGLDLVSRTELDIPPGGRELVPTGISLHIPQGYAGLVLPRSGLAYENGIGIVNSPGLIDPGYRGEVCVILINLDQNHTFHVGRGDRIAQLIFHKVERPEIRIVNELPSSSRGREGFGSTGR